MTSSNFITRVFQTDMFYIRYKYFDFMIISVQSGFIYRKIDDNTFNTHYFDDETCVL